MGHSLKRKPTKQDPAQAG